MGLNLKRKVGEKIIIDKDIEMEVHSIDRGSVILSFKFPSGRTVYRKEVIDKAKANGAEEGLYNKSS